MPYTPPKIINLNKPAEDVCERVLSLAMKNLRVSKSSQKLMRFYASCLNGCKAPLKAIESATGISSNHISERRKNLVKSGLMAYSGAAIVIDWNLLYDYAALDPSKMGNKCDWQILPDRKSAAYYVMRMKPRTISERRYHTFYMATRQAMLDGISFPDLTYAEQRTFIKPPLIIREPRLKFDFTPKPDLLAVKPLQQLNFPSEPLPF